MASQAELVLQNPPANAGDARDLGLIPGSGSSLEEGAATPSSVLAWTIPGQRSLMGCGPQAHKEADTGDMT